MQACYANNALAANPTQTPPRPQEIFLTRGQKFESLLNYNIVCAFCQVKNLSFLCKKRLQFAVLCANIHTLKQQRVYLLCKILNLRKLLIL